MIDAAFVATNTAVDNTPAAANADAAMAAADAGDAATAAIVGRSPRASGESPRPLSLMKPFAQPLPVKPAA